MQYEKKFSWAAPPEPVDDDKIKEIYAADVVIIGAGYAGTCAARGAAEEGASVIVLEKQDKDRDQHFQGGGEVGHINSKWQHEWGLGKVDVMEFMNDWQLRSNNRSNYKLVKKFAEKSGECFDWIIDDTLTKAQRDSIKMKHHIGKVPWGTQNFPGELNGIKTWVGTPHMGTELQLVAYKGCQEIARNLGAKFFFGISGEQLTRDNGRVTGVIGVNAKGEYFKFMANKGVILAAGDYSGNSDMCKDLIVEVSDSYNDGIKVVGMGQDGSGIKMGMWAGGRLEPRAHAPLGGYHSFPGLGPVLTTATLWVNKYGERYCNECFGGAHFSYIPGMVQPNGMLWSVFDSGVEEDISYQAPGHSSFDYAAGSIEEKVGMAYRLRQVMGTAVEAGANGVEVNALYGRKHTVFGANTIEDLAVYMFEDEESRKRFTDNVKRYNELCYLRRDEDFGKSLSLMHAVDEPPYYAYGFNKDSGRQFGLDAYNLIATLGGLLTDADQNVLDDNYEPIPGLFATGNNCGGRFGSSYFSPLPGVSIGIASTLGREAGITVAHL